MILPLVRWWWSSPSMWALLSLTAAAAATTVEGEGVKRKRKSKKETIREGYGHLIDPMICRNVVSFYRYGGMPNGAGGDMVICAPLDLSLSLSLSLSLHPTFYPISLHPDIFYKFTSFLVPGTIFRCDLSSLPLQASRRDCVGKQDVFFI